MYFFRKHNNDYFLFETNLFSIKIQYGNITSSRYVIFAFIKTDDLYSHTFYYDIKKNMSKFKFKFPYKHYYLREIFKFYELFEIFIKLYANPLVFRIFI